MSRDKAPKLFESKTPKVYKHKKLNNANFGDFTLNDYQVFLHLVSKIGGVDEFGKYLQLEQLQREHILSAKEFSEFFKTDLSSSYFLLHKACKKLMKTSIILEKPELYETWEINVCSKAQYNKNSGSILVKFTDDIMPYLAQVKQKFVLYNLKEIANFGSLYTTRLYELLQEFKETGWMLKSVTQLREAFAVGDSFKLYGHFKANTFVHACDEINRNYDIDLKFKEIKEGRKVVAVEFSFKPVVVTKVVNQKTGLETNIYAKKKTRKTSDKKRGPGLSKLSDILEGQLSFDDLMSDIKGSNFMPSKTKTSTSVVESPEKRTTKKEEIKSATDITTAGATLEEVEGISETKRRFWSRIVSGVKGFLREF